ncbi:universal stress protein [Kribbella sp. NPDC049174]|uniref:universal stress protein n=1 Tax=Kribbella sp. NPDC049174 TaxID=3364112 RepID=UPI0037116A8B
MLDEAEQARMLVLGSRGLGGWSGLILGSVTVQVSAHAHCPVVVIPPDLRPHPHTMPTVVVGVDGCSTRARPARPARPADCWSPSRWPARSPITPTFPGRPG